MRVYRILNSLQNDRNISLSTKNIFYSIFIVLSDSRIDLLLSRKGDKSKAGQSCRVGQY